MMFEFYLILLVHSRGAKGECWSKNTVYFFSRILGHNFVNNYVQGSFLITFLRLVLLVERDFRVNYGLLLFFCFGAFEFFFLLRSWSKQQVSLSHSLPYTLHRALSGHSRVALPCFQRSSKNRLLPNHWPF